jgi:hypothetical protein
VKINSSGIALILKFITILNVSVSTILIYKQTIVIVFQQREKSYLIGNIIVKVVPLLSLFTHIVPL